MGLTFSQEFGNKAIDQVAKYQASLKDGNLTDTGIPSAGPGGYGNGGLELCTQENCVESGLGVVCMVHYNIKYCEDTRSGQQLEATQQQHADFCKLVSAKAVALHTILLGIGGTRYAEHTLDQLKQLGLHHQRVIMLARKLHAHAHQKISNSFWSNPKATLKQQINLLKYRTGTIYTQKHAV
eukprot:1151814-Pelagomonas_calceolata.AAC.1